MAGAIKGITIEFRGETTSLDRALNNVKKEAKSTANELKYIDKAIKFNPTSVDAWKQKQIVLNKAIEETKQKLTLMKQGLREMEAQGLNAENSEEFRRMQREIDQTERHLRSLQTELRSVGNIKLRAASEQFKQWGQSLENAGQKMRGISMAAAAVTASIGAMAVKAGVAADDLNTMSKVTGIGTDRLQQYSLAADLVDVSVEDIAKSNKRLVKSAYSAANGSKTQAEAFDKLGVSVKDSDGNMRDSEAIYQDVISALGKMTNETERDALAQTLMGKSAANLNPLIEDGGETYKMVAETMAKYDLDYVDQETLDKANEFNDSIDTMKLMGKAAFGQVAAQLAGYLAPALKKVTDLFGKFASWLSKLSPQTLTIIAAIGGVVAVIAPLLIGLGKLAFAISSIMNVMAVIGPIIAGISAPVLGAVAAIGLLVAAGVALYKNWDTVKLYAQTLWANIVEVFTGIKEFFVAVWNEIVVFFQTIWTVIVALYTARLTLIRTVIVTTFNVVKTFIVTVWNAIKNAIQAALDAAKTVVTNAVNYIRNTITSVFNTLKTTVTNIWNGIKNAIQTALNAAKTAVTNIVNGIKSFVISGFNSLSSSVSTIWNNIKTNMTKPIESARDTLKKIIDKIKDFFPIKLGKIIKFQMPKISVSSKSVKVGDKEVKVPDFDISWASHAAGGIFDRPTLLTDRNGGLHEVGEAGAEAIIPLDRFWKTLETNNQRTDALLIQQNRILWAMLTEIQKDRDIKIDGRTAGRLINDLVRV